MPGFFTPSELKRSAPRMMSVAGCGLCKLHKQCHSPKMKATGDGELSVLFISGSPTEKEDLRDSHFVGKSGTMLRRICRKLGIDVDIDCRSIHAVCCRSNSDPTKAQVEACRPNLFKEIKSFKPKMIVPMGDFAIESLLDHRWKHGDLGKISKWRGFVIPDRELGCWVCPTYHPSYVVRNDNNKAIQNIFNTDLKTAFWTLKNRDFPQWKDEAKNVTLLMGLREIKLYLKDILKRLPPLLTVDYETTGLKPHAPGHRVVTIAFSEDGVNAFAFPYDDRIRTLVTRILQHPKIWMIAANMKFEEIWTRIRIDENGVFPWAWDTMLAAHCLDNRPKITGLKFQAYIRYGIIDYDSHINEYLKGVEDHANSLNRIHKVPVQDILVYNGIDSTLEHRLAMDQMLEMGITDPRYYFKKKTI